MTLILSFDPGKNFGSGKTGTGWCLQDADNVYDFGTSQDLIFTLHEWIVAMSRGSKGAMKRPDVVVYEGYSINPNQANQNVGKDLSAVQNIGAIKLFASLCGATIQMYRPDQKPSQWKATGKNPSKVPKAQSHWIDAYNHGRYYLIQNNLAPSALEIAMKEGTF